MAALLATACIAGCGGGDDTASSAGKPAGQPSGRAIEIGIVSQETVPGGVSEAEPREAAQARVDAVNAAGGIGGRPLRLIACDSKSNPNATAACARKMASEKVVAVIGTGNTTEAQLLAILERERIPVIGHIPATSAGGQSPVAFCFNPGVAGQFLGAPQALAAAGAKKVSMIFPGDVPVAGTAAQAFAVGAKKAGVQNAGVVNYSLGTSEFTPQVVKATGGGVDGVFPFAPAQALAPLLRTALQRAKGVKVVEPGTALGRQALEAVGAQSDGILVVGFGQPATADVPGIKRFNADMDAHAANTERNDFAINSWTAVWVLERVAKSLKGDISAATVMAAMRKLEDFDLGGIYPPLTTTGLPVKGPLPCLATPAVVYSKIKDGKPVALTGKFENPFPPAPTR